MGSRCIIQGQGTINRNTAAQLVVENGIDIPDAAGGAGIRRLDRATTGVCQRAISHAQGRVSGPPSVGVVQDNLA